MATVTPNFNWPVPTSTDLVKDGATAIEALGDSIDASLVDLKGGTTGQVLSKTSNTDMDFTWVAADDTNAIQNTIVDAKGDLIAASAADTPARLAVGSDGETLVADSSTSTGLRWQGDYAAGKNKIINGDFGIWQRGTSFAAITNASFTADRYQVVFNGTGVRTVSRQTFTPGAAPVAGYEGSYFLRYDQTTAGTGASYGGFQQNIENVETLAGQTATLSFWAKADSSRTISYTVTQSFGSGGSGSVTAGTGSQALTTSWTRYSFTISIPSISGKTIGTSSLLQVYFGMPINTLNTIDIWGVQLEAGSVATAFQTATGTIQGELAACQRYYFRWGSNAVEFFGMGLKTSATTTQWTVQNPVRMRANPTAIEFSGLKVGNNAGAGAVSAMALTWPGFNTSRIDITNGSTGSADTPGNVFTDSTGYFALTAEL